MHDRILDGLIDSTANLSVAQPLRLLYQSFPLERLRSKSAKARPDEIKRLHWRGKVVLHYIIETSEQRVVEYLRMVCSGDDQAIRLIVLDHLKEAI